MKSQKLDKANKHFSRQYFLCFGLIISFAIIFINIICYFSTEDDQFNLFYKYKKVYRLETWNIPNNVDVDINGDGVSDRITWTGCLTLSGTYDKDIISKQYNCHEDQSKGISIFNIEKSSLPQIRLSYIGKTNNNNLDVVLIKNLHADLFSVNQKGEVIRKELPISLKIDTAIYFISHLFVLFSGM